MSGDTYTTTRLSIDGMHCASCVAQVEKRIAQVGGVDDVSVNLATAEAAVRHDRTVTVDQLVQAVSDAGFGATKFDAASSGNVFDQASASARVWFWRVVFGGVLALPVMVLAMNSMMPWLQFALATPVQLVLGFPFYAGAWKRLRHGQADMDTLVAIGSTTAYVYSVVLLLNDTSSPVVFFESSTMILTLIALGKWLEAKARHSSAGAVRELMQLQPTTATVIGGDGAERSVPVDELRVGDVVLVRPGQRIAVDGRVRDGDSTIDHSMVTGESQPVEIGPGDDVVGGATNQTGSFRFEVTRTGEHTMLAQIVDLVGKAQATKMEVQRLADAVAGVFVQAVILIATATLLVWGFALGDWPGGLFAMIAVLIVACPCAMGLATPAAVMVGTGLGAKRGILIKDAAAFERAGRLTHIILDKTGTLTVGRPEVESIKSEMGQNEMLRLVASVEHRSEHPLARAIVRRADGMALGEVKHFESITAAGVIGEVDGHRVVVARPDALNDMNVANVDELMDRCGHENGQSIVAVAVDGAAVGVISLADQLKPEAKAVVDRLRSLGLKVILMTGDRADVAGTVSKQLGVDDVFAQVLPQDKHEKVRELQGAGHVVAMAGDGINDAPALAAADIGIAMSTGTNVAMEAGHVVLVGELGALCDTVTLSRATMTRIRTGLFWAFIYNALLIPLAALGVLAPMLAAAAMSLSSVSVVANALWLKHSSLGR